MATDILVPILLVLSISATLFALPPLFIQIQERNAAFCILISSVLVSDLMQVLNTLIWGSEDRATWWQGQVYCDIQIRLRLAFQVAIPGATACIFRQLSLAFHPSLQPPTRAQEKRGKILFYTLCWAVPIIRMATVYVIQPERYWILRVQGCILSIDRSWLSVVLNWSWAPIINAIAVWYAALAVRRILYHRKTTNTALGRTQNERSRSRTKRVLVFGLIVLITLVPVQAYLLYLNIPYLKGPYSWSRVHPPNWSQKIYMPRIFQSYFGIVLSQFLWVFYSVVAFVTLGFGPNARDIYKEWFIRIRILRWLKSLVKTTPSHLDTTRRTSDEREGHSRMMDRYEMEAISIPREV